MTFELNFMNSARAKKQLSFTIQSSIPVQSLRACYYEGRKRRVLILEKKLEVIQELKNGKSQRFVATLYSIPKSTVADIWLQIFGKIGRKLSAMLAQVIAHPLLRGDVL